MMEFSSRAEEGLGNFMGPKKVRLEGCSICQLECPNCQNASGLIRKFIGKNFLKLNDFKKFLNLNPTVDEIELSNFGEVFLNPQLYDIIKYSYSIGVKLRADNGCNLNTVSDKMLEGLCKYNFQSITCSIDGATNHVYSRYRRNGSFEKVLYAINKINYYKNKYKTKYPILTWQFILFPHNYHHFNDSKNMAKSLNMKFRYKLPWGDVNFNISPSLRDNIKKRTGLNIIDRKDYLKTKNRIYYHQVCFQLWKEIQINWDGKILGCCNNYWGSFGNNSFIDPLTEKIDSGKIAYGKKMLLGKVKKKPGIPCTTCQLYKLMEKYGLWLNENVAISREPICWEQ